MRGETAKLAAIYPFKLCTAILRGLSRQLVSDGVLKTGCIGLHMIEEQPPQYVMGIEESRSGDEQRSRIGGCTSITRGDGQVLSMAGAKPYIDDLAGIVLDSQLVQIAIKKELQYFEDKDVWKMEPIANAKKYTGKPPISVRWVHTNKGDDVTPDMRARFVAREIRHNGDEAIFAPSPPLETLRTVLSLAVTQLPGQQPRCRDPKSDESIHISLVDISRAYFHAKIDQRHPTFVELPRNSHKLGLVYVED